MAGHVRKRLDKNGNVRSWQARYPDPTNPGRRIERTFKTKSEALRWLTQQSASVMTGTHVDPRRGDRPFKEVVEAWRASWVNAGLEPKTRAGYESILAKHLLPEFGDRRVSAITPERIEAYIGRLLATGMAAGTVRSVFAALRRALNTAVRLRMLAANPSAGVQVPRATHKEMLFLAPEEVAAVAEAITPHFRVLVYTAAYTGLRAGELGALRRKRVDLLRGRLYVEEALKDLSGARLPEEERHLTFGPTKTHARRSISLPRFLRDMLAEHMAVPSPGGNGPDDLVFTMPSGSPVRHANFYKRHYRPAVRAALPEAKHGLRFHDLRHTCASLLIAASAHPKAIQERLGHKSITQTLDRYGHLMPGLGDALADALEATHATAAAGADNVVPLRAAE
jgi:integrase